jgi:hypothetical protein
MIDFLKRLFQLNADGGAASASMPLSGPSTSGRANAVRLPVPIVRRRMRDLLSDLQANTARERMEFKIDNAQSANELWVLRGDLYSVLAKQLSQQEAIRRVDGLLPSFEGWLPAWQLRKLGQ